MARLETISVPTTSTLASSQLIPSSHPAVIKTLNRLSRPSLLSLALDWLDERNQENIEPYLAEEDDEEDFYPPASSLEDLREIYTGLQARKGSKRDVTDRIIEGDWRNGLSLYQLAMADMQYLYDHPLSQKWTALKIVRLESEGQNSSKTSSIPRFNPSVFVRNLQQEILPDVKAHYQFDRHRTLSMLILRIFIVESPYNTSLALSSKHTTFDSSKTFYVSFPDDSPYIYVSLNNSSGQPISRSDSKSLRRITLEGIPKALSRPRERYKLESTSLSARNLEALVVRRGGGRTNAAGGAWGIYAEEKKDGTDNPLNIHLPTPDASESDIDELQVSHHKPQGMKRKVREDDRIVKRRKLVAKSRFGSSALPDDGKGIEKLIVRIDDPFPSREGEQIEDDLDELDPSAGKKKQSGRRSTTTLELDKQDEENRDGWRPDIRVWFLGQHVFAGIRELVEAGAIDGEKMPGWMTGEDGVSQGIVRDGRIKGYKGSGI